MDKTFKHMYVTFIHSKLCGQLSVDNPPLFARKTPKTHVYPQRLRNIICIENNIIHIKQSAIPALRYGGFKFLFASFEFSTEIRGK